MTALVTTEKRAELLDALDQLHTLGHHIASSLDLAVYNDPSKLGADRARLNFAARLAGEVMESLASLGTDPEAGE